MRIEILDGASVINTINADEAFAEQQHQGKWRKAAVQDAPAAPAVPEACSPAQGLIALYALKAITDSAVNTAVAGIADPAARYTAQVALSRATEWRRTSQTTQQLATLLGLTAADLDALFTYAVTVVV